MKFNFKTGLELSKKNNFYSNKKNKRSRRTCEKIMKIKGKREYFSKDNKKYDKTY